ncbi:DNA polymerase III subunit chi [Nitrosomonas halophila]|uniref:DNA polymerase III, chi subunit n=1 Tax=Nitrosomonas halophila TaxID=44576 RepID=A0A1H3I1K3_9PROT|nr:DNA polymerase III subunit chi [Nitrosomonas halophila]SDY21315.1 DNA polymerase III, chi subunit [Nitrosomonas halophila]
MKQIDFYTGAPDRLLIACRLCAKAVQQGLRTLVLVSDASLADQFDKLLWTFSPTSFVPHCRAGDQLAAMTPVILSDYRTLVAEGSGFDVLVNLDEAVPPACEQFSRIVEIVDEASDKKIARQRYRFYQEQGHAVRHHRLDLS